MRTRTSWVGGVLVAVPTVVIIGVLSSAGPSTSPAPSPAGAVVTDRNGFTLYRFDESRLPLAQRRTDPRIDPLPDRRLLTCDAGTPPDWPIVDHDRNPAVPGVDPSIVGFLERPGGIRHLAINGCPVYRHRADRPGRTTGDGTAGTWFAITPADLQLLRPPRSRTVVFAP
jgi:predicted lipoprotein with Yx(FWY)xxD motif